MLRNFFLIALRTMRRSPVYSVINIAGLSIGIACSILILLWVADEVTFDRFHRDYRNLYKVQMNQDFSGTIQTQFTLPIPVKEAIRKRSGKVKNVSLTNFGEGNLLSVGEKSISKVGLAVTEEFLKMFSFRMLE
ncbi:MAG TPA: ABC transporter permease, partial [Cyclobacteriaceae bacterium]|nr:ABC transporter permease [Cyclobacteriaceae bacterium]